MKISLDISLMLVMNTALFCLILRAVAEETVENRRQQMGITGQSFFVFMNIYVDTMENPRNCGGVLIKKDIVLSAARCFLRPHENVIRVIANVGDFADNRKGGPIKQIEAKSVEVYDKIIGFDKSAGKQQPPDIATVKLASKVGWEKTLSICGASMWQRYKTGKKLATIGMGKKVQVSKIFADILERLAINRTEELGKCREVKDSKVYDSKDVYCAAVMTKDGGGKNNVDANGKDICEGYEGNPVFQRYDITDVGRCLVGVRNKGIMTPNDNNPCEGAVLFTSVENYKSWVQKKQFVQIFPKKKTAGKPRTS